MFFIITYKVTTTRVLYVAPPSKFWVGGAPLRGDRRVIGLVIASVIVFIVVLIFPRLPLQEWLRITWLPSLRDYALVAGIVAIWAIILGTVWRWRLKGLGIDYRTEKRWALAEKRRSSL